MLYKVLRLGGGKRMNINKCIFWTIGGIESFLFPIHNYFLNYFDKNYFCISILFPYLWNILDLDLWKSKILNLKDLLRHSDWSSWFALQMTTTISDGASWSQTPRILQVSNVGGRDPGAGLSSFAFSGYLISKKLNWKESSKLGPAHWHGMQPKWQPKPPVAQCRPWTYLGFCFWFFGFFFHGPVVVSWAEFPYNLATRWCSYRGDVHTHTYALTRPRIHVYICNI